MTAELGHYVEVMQLGPGLAAYFGQARGRVQPLSPRPDRTVHKFCRSDTAHTQWSAAQVRGTIRRPSDRGLHHGDQRGDEGRSVLGRIAAIMDAFDQGEQVLTLVELSQRAGLPKSTVQRLAEQLRDARVARARPPGLSDRDAAVRAGRSRPATQRAPSTPPSPTSTRWPRGPGLPSSSACSTAARSSTSNGCWSAAIGCRRDRVGGCLPTAPVWGRRCWRSTTPRRTRCWMPTSPGGRGTRSPNRRFCARTCDGSERQASPSITTSPTTGWGASPRRSATPAERSPPSRSRDR